MTLSAFCFLLPNPNPNPNPNRNPNPGQTTRFALADGADSNIGVGQMCHQVRLGYRANSGWLSQPQRSEPARCGRQTRLDV